MLVPFVLLVSLLTANLIDAQVSCDFRQDYCGFVNRNISYIIIDSNSSIGLPDRLESNGYYALCRENFCNLNQQIYLSLEKKLTFWYFINGTENASLKFKLNNQYIWKSSSSPDQEWMQKDIQLPDGEYMINFEVSMSQSENSTAYVAIDRIELDNEINDLTSTTTSSWVNQTNQLVTDFSDKAIYIKIFVPIACAIVISALILSGYVLTTKWKRGKKIPNDKENMISISYKKKNEDNKVANKIAEDDYGSDFSFDEA